MQGKWGRGGDHLAGVIVLANQNRRKTRTFWAGSDAMYFLHTLMEREGGRGRGGGSPPFWYDTKQ